MQVDSKIKTSTGLDPYDLVERIAIDNPAADVVHIQRLVRRALAGPDAEYVDAFVDNTTERMLRRYLAREAEKIVTKPKAPVSSEKFAAPVRQFSERIPMPTTPRLDPQRQVPTPAPEPARRYEQSAPVRSVAIPERTIRVEKPVPSPARRQTVAPSRPIADLHFKRARAFLVGSLMQLLMPNGKKLADCTLRECDQFGSWFKGIRASAPRHAPLDAPVSLYFDDEKLRKIQTWTSDVYAD